MTSATSEYVAEIADREVTLRTPEDLDALLTQMPGTSHDVLVTRVTGRMKGIQKFVYSMLGLGTKNVGDSMHVLTNGTLAVVTFLNPAFDEFVARRATGSGPENVGAGGELEFKLSNGQQVTRTSTDCMPTEDAWRALREFVKTGQRPNWLTYQEPMRRKGRSSHVPTP